MRVLVGSKTLTDENDSSSNVSPCPCIDQEHTDSTTVMIDKAKAGCLQIWQNKIP